LVRPMTDYARIAKPLKHGPSVGRFGGRSLVATLKKDQRAQRFMTSAHKSDFEKNGVIKALFYFCFQTFKLYLQIPLYYVEDLKKKR